MKTYMVWYHSRGVLWKNNSRNANFQHTTVKAISATAAKNEISSDGRTVDKVKLVK